MPVARKASRPRTFRGLSADVRRAERRERLITAGIHAFGTDGFDAVTVRQICTEARLTERYFYESFDNLKDLFAAVYGRVSLQLTKLIWKAAAGAKQEPLAIAETSLRAFFSYVRENPQRARIMFIDVMNISPQVLRLAGSATNNHSALLSGYVTQLFPDVAALRGRPDLLAQGLVGAHIQMATYWIREKFRTPLEDVVFNALVLYKGLIAFYEASRSDKRRAAPVSATASRSTSRTHRPGPARAADRNTRVSREKPTRVDPRSR